MKTTTAIYALIDPRTGLIRYVGKANDPKRRLADHLRDTRDCHRVRWIQALVRDNLQPELTILEIVADAHWQTAEQRWIETLRAQGIPLTNATDGGDCGPVDTETRAKISKSLLGNRRRRGRTMPAAICQQISNTLKGVPKSDETRRRMSEAHKGVPLSKEHRERQSAANPFRGKHLPEETRRKISEARKKKPE
jgi:hypothetical protein